MSTTLYERSKDNVRVVALQEEGQEGKFIYKVQGFVAGEMIQENVIEAGYRATPGAARSLFKDLAAQHNPVKAKPVKEAKVMTEEEIQAAIVKTAASIEKATARHAKLVEQLAVVQAGGTVTEAPEVAEAHDAEGAVPQE